MSLYPAFCYQRARQAMSEVPGTYRHNVLQIALQERPILTCHYSHIVVQVVEM